RAINWMKNEAREKGKPTQAYEIDPEDLRKAVTVAIPKDTNLIQIDVEAESREKALEWNGAFCHAFEDWKKEIARTNTRDTLGNLTERLKNAKAKMLEDERQEYLYKQNHKFADVK